MTKGEIRELKDELRAELEQVAREWGRPAGWVFTQVSFLPNTFIYALDDLLYGGIYMLREIEEIGKKIECYGSMKPSDFCVPGSCVDGAVVKANVLALMRRAQAALEFLSLDVPKQDARDAVLRWVAEARETLNRIAQKV